MKVTRPAAIMVITGLAFVLAITILAGNLLRRHDRIIALAQDMTSGEPDPPDDALTSWGFPVPQTFTGSVPAGETRRHEVDVEKAGGVIFECVSGQYLRLALIDPRGARIDSAAIGIDSLRGYVNMPIEGDKVVTNIILGDNPPPGKWTVEIINPNRRGPKADYTVNAVIDRPDINLQIYTDKDNYQRNDTITSIAFFSKGISPMLDARIRALVYPIGPYPPEQVDTLQLFDDGTHGDKTSGDGKYSNIFTNTSQGGDFMISIDAESADEPPILRYGATSVIVTKNRARFTGKFGDFGRDTDGDGSFDELVIKVGIDIIDANRYKIKGSLRYSTPSGEKPAEGKEYIESLIDNASVDTFLSAGSHFVLLPFEGKRLSDKYRDGPYVLEHIVALAKDSLDGEGVDYLDDAYTTGKYKVRDFEGEAIIVIGNPTERAVDADGDGLYDSLIFTVDVDLREGDHYHWQGNLIGSGSQGVLATGEGILDAGRRTITLSFDGKEIRQDGGDGPYEISAPAMYGDRWKSVPRGEAGTLGGQFRTKAYRAEQFEE